jgi:hypothetical protein
VALFVCPSTGTIKVKLYATSEQFPVILYQVLQEVESEGYACREIYVDTFKVNFSAAAEEVAAMFRVRRVPVSAGTPQEMAYAESAVRVIGEMSRILMAGAPHLDESCWGLADVQAAYIHNFHESSLDSLVTLLVQNPLSSIPVSIKTVIGRE